MAEASNQKSDTGKFSMADIPPERLREYEKMPCLDFVNALRQCASMSRQFHMYYIYGHNSDCATEKQRVKDCMDWRTRNKEEAKEKLFQSLEEGHKKMYTPNPIWTYRESPPENW